MINIELLCWIQAEFLDSCTSSLYFIFKLDSKEKKVARRNLVIFIPPSPSAFLALTNFSSSNSFLFSGEAYTARP